MPSHPSDLIEKVISLGAVHRPQQIKAKLLMLLRAFIFQHEALIVEGDSDIKAMLDCGCDECRDVLPDAIGTYSQITSDLRQLVTAHDLVADVSAEFDRPTAESLSDAAVNLRERMIQACISGSPDEARSVLERLLSHTTDTETDAPQ